MVVVALLFGLLLLFGSFGARFPHFDVDEMELIAKTGWVGGTTTSISMLSLLLY